MMKKRIDQCLIAVTCSRMHNQAGRLVDDQQVVILEQDVERDILSGILGYGSQTIARLRAEGVIGK